MQLPLNDIIMLSVTSHSCSFRFRCNVYICVSNRNARFTLMVSLARYEWRLNYAGLGDIFTKLQSICVLCGPLTVKQAILEYIAAMKLTHTHTFTHVLTHVSSNKIFTSCLFGIVGESSFAFRVTNRLNQLRKIVCWTRLSNWCRLKMNTLSISLYILWKSKTI